MGIAEEVVWAIMDLELSRSWRLESCYVICVGYMNRVEVETEVKRSEMLSLNNIGCILARFLGKTRCLNLPGTK